MSLGEGYKGGEVRHMEGKLGEYSIMKEPREERLFFLLVGQIFSNIYHLLSMENIMVSKIDMVLPPWGSWFR